MTIVVVVNGHFGVVEVDVRKKLVLFEQEVNHDGVMRVFDARLLELAEARHQEIHLRPKSCPIFSAIEFFKKGVFLGVEQGVRT